MPAALSCIPNSISPNVIVETNTCDPGAKAAAAFRTGKWNTDSQSNQYRIVCVSRRKSGKRYSSANASLALRSAANTGDEESSGRCWRNSSMVDRAYSSEINW